MLQWQYNEKKFHFFFDILVTSLSKEHIRHLILQIKAAPILKHDVSLQSTCFKIFNITPQEKSQWYDQKI